MPDTIQILEPISQGEIRTINRCRRRYLYTYIDKLETPANAAMNEGSFVHVGLAAAYKDLQNSQSRGIEPNLARAVNEALAAVEDMVRNGHEYKGKIYPIQIEDQDYKRLGSVLAFYLENWYMADAREYEIVDVERTIQLPLGGALFEMTMDLVARHKKSGMLYVWDHKTSGQYVGAASTNLHCDPQFLIYEEGAYHQYAQGPNARIMMIRNMITRDVPPGFGYRELRVNKDGSIAKNNATQDPADYLKRETSFHSQRERANAIAEYIYTAYDARDYKPHQRHRYTRSIILTGGDACDKCPHYARCAADLLRG